MSVAMYYVVQYCNGTEKKWSMPSITYPYNRIGLEQAHEAARNIKQGTKGKIKYKYTRIMIKSVTIQYNEVFCNITEEDLNKP